MKNILYDTTSMINLQEFGIEIPIHYLRTETVIKALLDDEDLYKTRKEWLITENPFTIGRADLERIHSAQYCASLFSDRLEDCLIQAFELVNADGTWNRYKPGLVPLQDLFHPVLRIVAGTYYACRMALEKGFCFFMGGGMHHGHRDFGHGFCPTNDIVASARRLQHEKKAETIWVIDVDAHKGDGTAAITKDNSSIRTLSIHMAAGWPLNQPEYNAKGRFNPVFTPSDIDIGIRSGEESSYLDKLNQGLHKLEALSDSGQKPDLAIVVLGMDPHENDELPSTESMQLTAEQLLQRDQFVYQFLGARNIPAAYIMAGGYGIYAWKLYYRFLHWILCRQS